jgi:competence protein ComEA
MEKHMISRHGPIAAAISQIKVKTVPPRFYGTLGVVLSGTLSIVALALFICQDVSVSAQQAGSIPGVSPEVAKKFPDDTGKATFLRICSKCHSPMNVLATGETREEWEGTITKMAGLGAVGSDEEFTEILDYLEKNFPPRQKIDVNKATASQLEKFLQLEPATANAIVAYRDKHGDFKSLDDMKQVPGVDAAALEAKKALMTFD